MSTKEAEETVQLWYSDRPEVRAWQEVQHRKAAEKGKEARFWEAQEPPEASSDEARRQHAPVRIHQHAHPGRRGGHRHGDDRSTGVRACASSGTGC